MSHLSSVANAHSKASLRELVLSRRDLVPADVRAEWSATACVRLMDELRRRQAAAQRRVTVGSFVSFRSEIDTACVNAELLRAPLQFRLALPRVNLRDRALQFFVVDNTDEGKALHRSRFGILEPNRRTNAPVDVADIDILVTPGVAFNADGARLGHGGGFYDRVLAARRGDVPAIAYAFDSQVLRDDYVPMNPSHDYKVDQIVTEKQTINVADVVGGQEDQ